MRNWLALMASTESNNGGPREDDDEHTHVVEMVETAESDSDSDQIAPLLDNTNNKPKPKINIFSVSYPPRRPNRVICSHTLTSTCMSITFMSNFCYYCIMLYDLDQLPYRKGSNNVWNL